VRRREEKKIYKKGGLDLEAEKKDFLRERAYLRGLKKVFAISSRGRASDLKRRRGEALFLESLQQSRRGVFGCPNTCCAKEKLDEGRGKRGHFLSHLYAKSKNAEKRKKCYTSN